MVPKSTSLELVLELAHLEHDEDHWNRLRAAIPAWHPRNDAGEGEGEGGGGEGEGEGEGEGGGEGEGDGGTTDWKAQSRKHEREAKKLRKEKEALAAAAKERETETLSEQEKAIAKAREEAKAEATSEVEQERRHDRLEVSVTRLASKTFADTEDALIHIERAIRNGDIDADDIFDSEGKVQTAALKTELEQLLERKKHLAAVAPGPGENDAGRGSGGADAPKGVKAHLEHIQKR